MGSHINTLPILTAVTNSNLHISETVSGSTPTTFAAAVVTPIATAPNSTQLAAAESDTLGTL